MRYWLTTILLLYLCHALNLCKANNVITSTSATSSLELLHEFRRHYYQFNAVVHQVTRDETDSFHLQSLLEDLNEFSNLAAQSHHGRPEVIRWEHTGSAGRPRATIDPDFLRWAYTHRTTNGIARFLGVSQRTVRRALLVHGIASPGNAPVAPTQDENENDGTTDNLLDPRLSIPNTLPIEVQTAAGSIRYSSSTRRHSNIVNDDLDSLIRLLRSYYPRAGIQMFHGMLRSLGHIVPYERIRHSLIRVDPVHRVFERIRIRRRVYSVPGPNSLWHHDGHHCKSVHNVRIERLWVDVSNYISQNWNDIFTRLEMHHQLDVNNPNHIWLLHYLFINTINESLAFWVEGWNCHRISQRRGGGPARSPEDMWGFDMLAHGLRGDPVDQYTMTDAELEVFGVDWEGLRDNDLLRSLRRNYAHEEGSNTWLGRGGPPEHLNEVRVDPPSGLMTAHEIQPLDVLLLTFPCRYNETDVVNIWHSALVYTRTLYPNHF
ncbi:hypothetical protein EV361DRAFT_974035 [Lentinula raphanica]|nr:hypothetical protein EV361DRAFT_974035 [Lentinula raphanica]